MNDIIQTAQDKDYSSFSDEVKSILQDKLQDKLQEQGYGQPEKVDESESGDEYRAFFAKALKKFGVKSPDDLGDKSDEFYDYVKANKPSK
jgi:hypothetical protein